MSAPLDDLMGNELTEHVVNVEPDDEIEISVVDDRPEEDQVEPRSDSSESSEDDSEIEAVGGRAQKRIKKLKYEYHEERRSKEAANRTRDEAVSYAQQVATENNKLKSLLQRGERVLLSEIKQRADSDLVKARVDYKAAYEAGDPDKLVDAQEALTRSQYDKEVAERTIPMVTPAPTLPVPQSPPQEVDPKLRGWLQENKWFGDDKEMTSFAYGVHENLVTNEGVDPRSDDYYKRIDDRLRSVFPNKFGGENGAEEPAASPRTRTVVASANRSSGRPRKVQLTSTQVDLARRLGITPEQYAKQLLKER